MQKIILSFLGICLVLTLSAQTNPENADSILQASDTTTITVLGSTDLLQSQLNGKEKLTGTEPNAINALDHLPGIFKIQEAGFPIVFRGMSASRLRIERNGALRTGFVTQGYLLDDVNPENVDQISIVKGAEAVLFGSGSLGGVIRIDESSAKNHRNNSAYLSYSSNQKAKTGGIKIGKRSEAFGWLLSGRLTETDDFTFGGGDTADNSAQDQQNLKLSIFKTDSAKTTEWTWNNDFSSGKIERPQSFQNNPFELRNYSNRYTYQSNFTFTIPLRAGARIEQNIWVLFLETDQEIRNFNGSFSQLNVYENRNYEKDAFGYRLNWYLREQGAWKVRLGGDFITSALDQRNSREDFINQVIETDFFVQSRRENMSGLFGMASHSTESFQVDFSLRADFARIGNRSEDVNYKALSGGLNLNWKGNEHLRNVISLTRQFRYPTQDESVGIVFGGRGIFRGNPDVKPEISYQLEWNLIGKSGKYLEFVLSSWFALFEDRISAIATGNGEFSYFNLDRARTMGIEGRIDYQIPNLSADDLMFLSLSGTFTQGDELTENGWFSSGEPLFGIPPGRIRLSGKWQKQVSEKFSLHSSANIDHVLAYNRLPSGTIRQTFAVQEAGAYWLADLQVSGRFSLPKQSLHIGINITNLSDAAFFPFGARIMGMGRNVTGYVRLTF